MKKVTYQPKQVRIFLVLLFIVAILLTLKITRHGATETRWLAMAVETVIISALLVVPKFFFPAFKVIMTASGYLGSFIFSVLAIVVFFLILTPLALVMRIFGKKFMHPAIDPALPSYYLEAEAGHDLAKQY